MERQITVRIDIARPTDTLSPMLEAQKAKARELEQALTATGRVQQGGQIRPTQAQAAAMGAVGVPGVGPSMLPAMGGGSEVWDPRTGRFTRPLPALGPTLPAAGAMGPTLPPARTTPPPITPPSLFEFEEALGGAGPGGETWDPRTKKWVGGGGGESRMARGTRGGMMLGGMALSAVGGAIASTGGTGAAIGGGLTSITGGAMSGAMAGSMIPGLGPAGTLIGGLVGGGIAAAGSLITGITDALTGGLEKAKAAALEWEQSMERVKASAGEHATALIGAEDTTRRMRRGEAATTSDLASLPPEFRHAVMTAPMSEREGMFGARLETMRAKMPFADVGKPGARTEIEAEMATLESVKLRGAEGMTKPLGSVGIAVGFGDTSSARDKILTDIAGSSPEAEAAKETTSAVKELIARFDALIGAVSDAKAVLATIPT